MLLVKKKAQGQGVFFFFKEKKESSRTFSGDLVQLCGLPDVLVLASIFGCSVHCAVFLFSYIVKYIVYLYLSRL